NGTRGGARRARRKLANSIDCHCRAGELTTVMSQVDLRGSFDSVSGSEVVHPETLVLLRPQGKLQRRVRRREIGGKCPHVRPGEEELLQGLEGAPIGRHDRLTIPACETYARLG